MSDRPDQDQDAQATAQPAQAEQPPPRPPREVDPKLITYIERGGSSADKRG